MAFSCNTDGFPSLSSYTEAKAHFDSVKPYRSSDDSDPRPIGVRSHKHKNMRLLNDGSIAFCLFDTDCVIWHPNNDLTVRGYATMSTSAFISSLTPSGVYHGKGRKDADEPVLHLAGGAYPDRPWPSYHDPRYPEMSRARYAELRAWWSSGIVINCDWPVRLNYNVERERWQPVSYDDLQPFVVPRIDRKAAREVSRRYNLPLLDKTLNAVMALAQPPTPAGQAGMGEIMAVLEEGKIMQAIAMFPRGQLRTRFHRTYGTPTGIRPGFVRELRDHIYEHEGVIEHREERVLTPASYKRYITLSNRFG